MTDKIPESWADKLNKKVDAVIDHTATELGKLEKTLESHHGRIIESNKEARGYVDTEIGKLRARTDSTSNVLENMADRIYSIEASPPAPDRTDLYKALVAAQLEIRNADTNVINEFTNKKYADLASVMNAVREPLAKNGLAIIQLTEDQDHGVLGIRTLLVHESGQVIEDHITMTPEKSTPQGIGSCRTYMRRYAVLAICAIAGAIDDDAGGATKDPNDYPRIEIGEVEKILYVADELFGEHADDAVALMLQRTFTHPQAQVVGDIPAGELEVALTYLNRAKKARDDKAAEAMKAEKAAAKAAKEKK